MSSADPVVLARTISEAPSSETFECRLEFRVSLYYYSKNQQYLRPIS
jgi:hypothetical protein